MGVSMGLGEEKAMLQEKGVGMGVAMDVGVVVAEACNETRDTRRGIARKDAEKREIANAPG